jgi:5-deoxy-glucuronate isomerase
MIIKHPGPAPFGYETIIDRDGTNADMLLDFGLLRIASGDSWSSGRDDEKALLLISGSAELIWPGESGDSTGAAARAGATRRSVFDESPSVLHLSEGSEARIVAGPEGAELAVIRTGNTRRFPAKLYRPEDCRSEERGKGTMRETSTRIVRTVFDNSNAPEAMLVLGEVVAAPGKWSSYPPHHHPQPEIYHYRFDPDFGFGLTAIGAEAHMIENRDTVLIRAGQAHPQAAAPGYAMWYIWVIRHLVDDRYIAPTFAPEHAWVMEKHAEIWAPPYERGDEKR